MSNIRPSSASQFQRPLSTSALTLKSRPTTALIPIPEHPRPSLNIELSFENEHATLPKTTLGSRLSQKVTRPKSAIPHPSAAFKINTQVLSKFYTPDPIAPNILESSTKVSRISLAKKLRSLCNVKSYKLLKDCIKEEPVNKRSESLACELREIWKNCQNDQEKKKIRPQTAIKKIIKTNHVYLPGFEKSKLSIIHETKKQERDAQDEEMKFLRKACDIQIVGRDTGLNIPIFPVFPGKVVKRRRRPAKLQRSQTEILIKPN